MQIAGRRIHIAGSASPDVEWTLIRYAHDLIGWLVRNLASRGATFAVGVGKEPLASPGDVTSPAIVYDWTVLATAHECLASETGWEARQGRFIGTVATSKTDRQIPEFRRQVWTELNNVGAVNVEYAKPGWASGAYRREALARTGDVLVVLGGGEGVEHLAQTYALARKPVIALDLDIGSSSRDGSGGATRLAAQSLSEPNSFLCLSDPTAVGSLLSDLTTRNGTRPVEDVVAAIIRLMEALAPPTAFYVRLLNPNVQGFAVVDRYFRNVVDPMVTGFGFKPVEMGQGLNDYAWMNQAIFDNLHHAAVAVVDLTGLRPNCFMELGYALGRAQRVILTARKGTRPPFDAQMLEVHFWSPRDSDTRRSDLLRAYWQRNVDRPPLVRSREVV